MDFNTVGMPENESFYYGEEIRDLSTKKCLICSSEKTTDTYFPVTREYYTVLKVVMCDFCCRDFNISRGKEDVTLKLLSKYFENRKYDIETMVIGKLKSTFPDEILTKIFDYVWGESFFFD